MRATASSRRIIVGTASWSDPGFVEHWYPKNIPAADRLPWYAQHFEMVEVNSSFYAIPDGRMAERWCRCTPDGFTFNVKLHQLLSRHSTAAKLLPPKLRRQAETDNNGRVLLTPELERLVAQEFRPALEVMAGAGKLGSLLLQLSPSFSPRVHALQELEPVFESLGGFAFAVEFRNRHWTAPAQGDEMLRFLREHNATFVVVDAPRADHFTVMPADLNEVTTPRLAYLRLHGRDARAYTTGKTVAARFNYDYNDAEIGEIADRAQKLARSAEQVHVVFNNNARDYAPHAAARLRAALGQIVPTRSKRQAELF
ncbi:MAG: DUF72 domain-containing protein [Chthoniobacterales bacterium]|nr:DUF72 domain-containing protein [Chthoniobacterales bacterium]